MHEEPSICNARVSFWAALIVSLMGLLGWYSDDTTHWPSQEDELPYHCGNPDLADTDSVECTQ